MSNLLGGVRKLEGRLKDISGLVPHSEQWFAHWKGKLDQFLAGELPDHERIPLEYIDAIREASQSAAVEGVAHEAGPRR